MPRQTFLKLSIEKKNKIIKAAKREFARVPFEETSIKNIVEDAGIARGSFYQYFESKEDLLIFLLKNHVEEINSNIEEVLKDKNGDIFELYIIWYDFMVDNFIKKDDMKLFKRIFENIKTTDEEIFSIIKENTNKPKKIYEYYDIIDKNNLKIESAEDLEIICKMLNTITKKSIISSFKYPSSLKAREDYMKQIQYLKYGILKNQ